MVVMSRSTRSTVPVIKIYELGLRLGRALRRIALKELYERDIHRDNLSINSSVRYMIDDGKFLVMDYRVIPFMRDGYVYNLEVDVGEEQNYRIIESGVFDEENEKDSELLLIRLLFPQKITKSDLISLFKMMVVQFKSDLHKYLKIIEQASLNKRS